MPVPVSQGRVKKFTTDGPIPPPHSRRGVVPQVDPTKKLVAAPGQLLDRPGAIRSSTRRGRGVPCGRHPPYRLLRPASLSPLLPTAMPGWGMATPPIRAFPQRRPARSTPCKPKGSVLPRFIGPGGRARRAKKCIGLRVGGAKRVAASKAALPPKKRRALFPSQLSFKEQWLWQSAKKRGQCRDLSLPPRRPMQNSLPFPAPLPNLRGRHPTPSRLSMPPPLSWVAGPSTPHRRSAPSPTPSPVRPRQTPLPPMERPISPRGPAARNRNRGQTR